MTYLTDRISATTVKGFVQQIESFSVRLGQLYKQANVSQNNSPELLLPRAFKELGSVSEVLQIAAEELIEQNSELQAARESLEQERQRYQELFELAPDAYLLTDSAGIVREANRAASTMLNISPQFLIGKPLWLFIAEEDRQSLRLTLNKPLEIKSNHEYNLHVAPRHSQSFNAALTISVSPSSHGKTTAYRICIRQIGERKTPQKLVERIDDDLIGNRSKFFYAKGEEIPLKPDSIWVVCQGLVKTTTVCDNGEEIITGLVGPSMPFGSCLTQLEIYQAVALSKSVQLVAVSVSELAASGHLAQTLLPKLTRRLQQNESFVAISGQRRVSDRLEHLLRFLKAEIGQPAPQGTRLSVRLTHSDLANACCTTRVTMTRLLGRLQEEGKICFDSKSHLILKDVDFERVSKQDKAG